MKKKPIFLTVPEGARRTQQYINSKNLFSLKTLPPGLFFLVKSGQRNLLGRSIILVKT